MNRARRVPTQFERRVYAVVRRIPKGQTRSYRWVAGQLGNPQLARAVGNALNRNPRPFPSDAVTQSRSHPVTLVPCHRVIRTNGSLGGYAAGPTRKRTLLRREGVPFNAAAAARSSVLYGSGILFTVAIRR